MITEHDIAALDAGRHPDPFAVLGMHADPEGVLHVCVHLPHAVKVAVCDAASGRRIAYLQRCASSGVFEARLGRRKQRFAYLLAIDWDNGAHSRSADVYAFGPTLTAEQLAAFNRGDETQAYTLFGAHPETREGIDGVRFAVWAPRAHRVSVVGDFNAWDGRRHPMRKHFPAGVWDIFIPDASIGQHYRYEIIDAYGNLLPLKSDPFAFASQLRPDNASIISCLPPTRTLSKDRQSANACSAPLAVYEVHVGSWQRGTDGSFLDWDTLTASLLPYVKKLGFTHIELLPVMEHPFDGSWGYQTVGLFAPSARQGDGAGFSRFVQAAHALGLGVLLDWVPAHFPKDAHNLILFDGQPLYEYADPREGEHQDWGTLIYNYARPEIQSFLLSSARFWLERYGVDGLRVDAVSSMIYRDYSRAADAWIPNQNGGRDNLEALDFLRRLNQMVHRHHPGALCIAEESTAYPRVTGAIEEGGLGFDYKWNMGWMHDTLAYIKEDPIHRRWHHQRMTFGLVYAWNERFMLPLSHDEVVHGKASLLGKIPGDPWQQCATLKAYYGFMWGQPGKKLLFMGAEFGQRHEWQHDHALDWPLSQKTEHQGISRWVSDLNSLYRQHPALYSQDHSHAGFAWSLANAHDDSIFAWLRYDELGNPLLFVVNFTPVIRTDYLVPVPDTPLLWQEVLNSDASEYAGSGVGNQGAALPIFRHESPGRTHALRLTLPPLATLILQALPPNFTDAHA